MARLPKLFMASGLIFFLLGSSVLAAGRSSSAPSQAGKSLEKAPSFRLRDLEGKEVQLEDYAGRVILLDFWASWCPPCQEEIPGLIKVYREYREKGFVILGISVGEDPSATRGFAKKIGIPYPVLFGDRTVLEAYKGVYFLPTAFLIDRKGNIRERLVGAREAKELEAKILPLLETP